MPTHSAFPYLLIVATTTTLLFIGVDLGAEVVCLVSFDEGSGASVREAFGSTGQVVGNVQWTDGKHGPAFMFDGETSIYFRDATMARDAIVESLAVGVWVSPSVLGGWRTIVLAHGAPWKLGLLDNRVHLTIWGNLLKKDHHAPTTIPRNQWTHVAATYDRQFVKVYIDGALDFVSPTPHEEKLDLGFFDFLDVGGRGALNLEVDQAFTGKIDDLFLADTAMSATDIMQAMNGEFNQIGHAASIQLRRLTTMWGSIKDRK